MTTTEIQASPAEIRYLVAALQGDGSVDLVDRNSQQVINRLRAKGLIESRPGNTRLTEAGRAVAKANLPKADTTTKPRSTLPYTRDNTLRAIVAREDRFGAPPPQGPMLTYNTPEWHAAAPQRQKMVDYRARAESLAVKEFSNDVHSAGAVQLDLEDRGLAYYDRDTGYLRPTNKGRQFVADSSPTPKGGKPRTDATRPKAPTGPRVETSRLDREVTADEARRVMSVVDTADEAQALGFAYAPDRPITAGDEVMVNTFGRLRGGIVTQVGTKNTKVAYMTPSGGFVQETTQPTETVLRKVGERKPGAFRGNLTPARVPGGSRPVMTEEEKAAAKAAQAVAQKERQADTDRKWLARQIEDVRRRVRDAGTSRDHALTGVTDRGILMLAREVGVKIPQKRTDRGGLRRAIVDAIVDGTVTEQPRTPWTWMKGATSTGAAYSYVGKRGVWSIKKDTTGWVLRLDGNPYRSTSSLEEAKRIAQTDDTK